MKSSPLRTRFYSTFLASAMILLAHSSPSAHAEDLSPAQKIKFTEEKISERLRGTDFTLIGITSFDPDYSMDGNVSRALQVISTGYESFYIVKFQARDNRGVIYNGEVMVSARSPQLRILGLIEFSGFDPVDTRKNFDVKKTPTERTDHFFRIRPIASETFPPGNHPISDFNLVAPITTPAGRFNESPAKSPTSTDGAPKSDTTTVPALKAPEDPHSGAAKP